MVNEITRIAAHAIVVTADVIGVSGSAFAADMTGAEMKAFLSARPTIWKPPRHSSTGRPAKVALVSREEKVCAQIVKIA
jgi:hypothetical protein